VLLLLLLMLLLLLQNLLLLLLPAPRGTTACHLGRRSHASGSRLCGSHRLPATEQRLQERHSALSHQER
jgi:hypothetical protein